jgi:hypothetical protein
MWARARCYDVTRAVRYVNHRLFLLHWFDWKRVAEKDQEGISRVCLSPVFKLPLSALA